MMCEMVGRIMRNVEANKRGLAASEDQFSAGSSSQARIIDTHHLSETPLMVAARAGNLEEVQRLLSSGAHANVCDDLGETPLFEAAASGFTEVTAALLLHNADPQKRSLAGGLAGDLAADKVNKLLLDFFSGVELSNDEKYVVVFQAIMEPDIRDRIAEKFREANMRQAYQHTLRKLRA